MLRLKHDFRIESDILNFTLIQHIKYKGKDGQEKDKDKIIGYFATPEHALERYITELAGIEIKDRDINVKELICLFKELKTKGLKE